MRKVKFLSSLFLLCSMVGYSQNNTGVSGVIVDTNGEPLIGVSITIKGASATGTATDVEGRFSLPNASSNAVLIASYIGYTTREIPVNGQSVLHIALVEDVKALDEVIVVGYGTMRKGDVTSAVGSVKRDDFIQGSVKDAGQLIQGKVAGLAITNPSGNPVSGTSTSLRGIATISGTSANPLVLVDGVPGDFSTVAPEDIESVDVLKDGSAAAIYGSRATNGVILISTRKAKGDKINEVEYNAYMSTASIAKKMEMLAAQDYRDQINAGTRDKM